MFLWNDHSVQMWVSMVVPSAAAMIFLHGGIIKSFETEKASNFYDILAYKCISG